MKSAFVTICAVLMFTASVTLAGNEGGHGGDGLKVKGKVYLLDLLESGLEEDAYVDPAMPINSFVHSFLSKRLPFDVETLKLLTQKILEIRVNYPYLSDLLLLAIDQYPWKFVNRRLNDLADEGESPIQYPKEDLVQLAVRTPSLILIDKKYWDELAATHRVALILHEMIFALIRPEKDGQGKWFQNSRRAREIVGLLFDQDIWSEDKRRNLIRIIELNLFETPYKDPKNHTPKNRGISRLYKETDTPWVAFRIISAKLQFETASGTTGMQFVPDSTRKASTGFQKRVLQECKYTLNKKEDFNVLLETDVDNFGLAMTIVQVSELEPSQPGLRTFLLHHEMLSNISDYVQDFAWSGKFSSSVSPTECESSIVDGYQNILNTFAPY